MTTAPTPSQTVGPFFSFALDLDGGSQLVPPDAPGALLLGGRVLDGAGEPVPDAVVEIWHAAASGRFDGHAWSGFGRCLTDTEGRYRFTTCKPGRVDERQAPHVDVSIFARGLLQRLVTRVYFPDERAANAVDPVLASVADPARQATLVARPEPSNGGGGLPALRFDIVLQGDAETETVFFAW